MSLDYYIDFPCKVRAQTSNEDLLRMEKAKKPGAGSVADDAG